MDETEEHNLNIPVEMLKTLKKSFKNRTFLTRILRNCWSMAKVSYKRNDKKCRQKTIAKSPYKISYFKSSPNSFSKRFANLLT